LKKIEQIKSCDLKVGDFIIVRDECKIPADIVLMGLSINNKLAYVETKDLDGETNLKLKRVTVPLSKAMILKDNCPYFNGLD
jgi:phospholipid-translocating ATPase